MRVRRTLDQTILEAASPAMNATEESSNFQNSSLCLTDFALGSTPHASSRGAFEARLNSRYGVSQYLAHFSQKHLKLQ
jgi:hypothetical protein